MSKDEALIVYKTAIDALYNHDDATRELVIQHFGLHHPHISCDEITPDFDTGQGRFIDGPEIGDAWLQTR